MGYTYLVLGAGRQGTASAYDLARNGDAEQVLIADRVPELVEKAAERLNALLGSERIVPRVVDVGDRDALLDILTEADAAISAVPYIFNLEITRAAIGSGTSLNDLGGNTGIVRKQLELTGEAEKAGVSVVPDCGMGPGMNISLAVYAMSFLDEPRDVFIWDGGLPQKPEPPWNYRLTFNIGGLTNEYYGNAYFLRDGKVTEVPCFEGYQLLDVPPLGKLEAFVTSGGLSTAPWTFEGKLRTLENRTLRYPGHHAQFKAFSDLGLLSLEPVRVGDIEVIPRDLFHALLEPKIYDPDVRDVGVIMVRVFGRKDGGETEVTVKLVDYYDEETGFTAMQRLTGWHASIISILQAKGIVMPGAHPVEIAVPGELVVKEARKRGFDISVKVKG